MDFSTPPELAELRKRVRSFVDERIIPAEPQLWAEARAGALPTLATLRAEARAAGLWTPHLPTAWGGLGLGVSGMCALFREMGRSLFGPRAFHCDAPDQGNMELLLLAGTEPQKARWLEPLVRGDSTSAFCLTEPAPGAGADPKNLQTWAERRGDRWCITGHKWYSTGGVEAELLIVAARTSDDPRRGATFFLVPRSAPGVTCVRDVPTMAEHIPGHSHAEFRFDEVEVSSGDVLGAEGQGFALAQARLVPARLTHCMRWLGLADRALSLCRDYVSSREAFGVPLARHELVQQMLAESAQSIHAGNLMTWHCAWLLEQGDVHGARGYSSMCKHHVANALCDTLDRAIQMHGGLGYSEDMPFSRWYRFARAARLADGPDEVHTGVVARDWLAGRLELLV